MGGTVDHSGDRTFTRGDNDGDPRSKNLLGSKLDAVTGEVVRLGADFQKMSEKVTSAETHIKLLQSTSKKLEEKAYRALGPAPNPGAPPRTIIARVFYYRDRDAILQEARSYGDIKYENATIHFFPDFTLRVQRKR
ncbi:hypothetical protein NDU88_001029 [Pleurodeles waltl]|uniref:Uncharacterized protein n=1 Tax=Pleurodeles waltl TaxID=8319 RepID=A0AAV7P2L1_PLEWA|nr:hypothetical protein NDU88_001029 [Pleurodeles waltl]